MAYKGLWLCLLSVVKQFHFWPLVSCRLHHPIPRNSKKQAKDEILLYLFKLTNHDQMSTVLAVSVKIRKMPGLSTACLDLGCKAQLVVCHETQAVQRVWRVMLE